MNMHDTVEECPKTRDPYQESNLTSNQLQVWIAQNLLPEVPIYTLRCAALDGESIRTISTKRSFLVF